MTEPPTSFKETWHLILGQWETMEGLKKCDVIKFVFRGLLCVWRMVSEIFTVVLGEEP